MSTLLRKITKKIQTKVLYCYVQECCFAQAAAATVLKNNLKSYAIVSCKRKELNHYETDTFRNVADVPLASNGWRSRKSVGDFFTLYPNHERKIQNTGETNFQQLGLSNEVIRVLNDLNCEHPTPIQEKAIPIVLTGVNSVIGAETGSGKTLAYLLPVIERVLLWREEEMKRTSPERGMNSPLAVILVPSRELACQIGEVVNYFAQALNFNAEVIIGGNTKKIMMNPHFRSIELLIATLGAMSKLTTTGIFRMGNCHHLVLDEADNLLDDSFNEKLRYFLKHFKLQYGGIFTEHSLGTQLTLVGATLPTNIEQSLGYILPQKSFTDVSLDQMHTVLSHVPQKFVRINRSGKPTELLRLVKKSLHKNEPVIVFSNKSTTCDWVSMFLNENGINCMNLNGEMPAALREGTFRQFQDGFYNVISFTDIGSRGLNTKRVRHVINYDFPLYMADYIHRAGRTGRLDSPNNCHVTSLVSSEREVPIVQQIERSVRLKEKLPNVNGNITQVITRRILKSVRRDISNVNKM